MYYGDITCISSSVLVMKTVLCLLFDKNKFAIATYITIYWLNQPINFYSDIYFSSVF